MRRFLSQQSTEELQAALKRLENRPRTTGTYKERRNYDVRAARIQNELARRGVGPTLIEQLDAVLESNRQLLKEKRPC